MNLSELENAFNIIPQTAVLRYSLVFSVNIIVLVTFTMVTLLQSNTGTIHDEY